MNTTTKKLQDLLEHCIGRKTVEFCNGTVYHFNAPILTIEDNKIILNSRYYAYSASTSRVRNRAIEYFSGCAAPCTLELSKARKNGEILRVGNMEIFFDEWFYNEDIA